MNVDTRASRPQGAPLLLDERLDPVAGSTCWKSACERAGRMFSGHVQHVQKVMTVLPPAWRRSPFIAAGPSSSEMRVIGGGTIIRSQRRSPSSPARTSGDTLTWKFDAGDTVRSERFGVGGGDRRDRGAHRVEQQREVRKSHGVAHHVDEHVDPVGVSLSHRGPK